LSSSNPRVRELRRLIGRRSSRYDAGRFIVEGPGLIRDAFDAGWNVREVYVRDGVADPLEGEVECNSLDSKTFDSVSDTVSPQGVMAVVDMREAALDAGASTDNWSVVLESVSDPGNMGTIIRSAEASGCGSIVLVGECVDPFSPKVVRSSAGALFHVPVVVGATWTDVTRHFTRLVGTTSHDSIGSTKVQSVYDVDLGGSLAVVLGNEAKGVSAVAPVSEWVTIPHVGRSESLNVAMAATVLCMHIARSRREMVSRRQEGGE
jgi:TrmH family RNA methyltransferase